ncbi:MAG: GspE/PulE family protein [Candidatus Yanofskybacteria bacterium]|nr:GspE/PulE family protein [Candidatus Yanofskybacteria bacterium]
MDGTTPNKNAENLEKELEKKLQSITSKSHESAAAAQAQQQGLPFSNLQSISIDAEALKTLGESEARQSGVAVIYRNGSALVVAVIDPNRAETKAMLLSLQKKGFTIRSVVTTEKAIENVWARYKTFKSTELFEVGAIEIDEKEIDKLQSEIGTIADLRKQVGSVPVTKLLEILLAGALKTQASDIHFEPEIDKVRLRYRLDGLLHDITDLDKDFYEKVLNRLKVISKLKLNIHRTPQDGRFTIRQQSIDIEVRVSILPSEYGETVVMRLLDPRTIRTKLEELGMRDDVLALVKEQIKKPNGTLLTTGPTGSGKTTTLYAFINTLNSSDTKIITIEDPIEYHIQGISQTQVDSSKDYTFASGLRSIVRQDPDIILVGEIRDFETADIALNAALTGHLVLSTIHTNDAAGTIPRLIDLGIKAPLIAPAISMAMGQRLVRKLCPSCRKKGAIEADELKKIQRELEPLKERFKLPELNPQLEVYFPGKCSQCNETGYKGRVGVYEVFVITREMEKLILTAPAISDIRDSAIQQGMITMIQDGYLKLLEGVTSLEEIHRILG